MSKNTTATPTKADGTTPTASGEYSFTLASGSVYYVPFQVEGLVASVHMLFDSASIITSVEVEDSNLPEATINSVVVGEWIKEDPAGAEVEVVGNCASVGAVVSKTAGAVGAAMVHLSNLGSLRGRLKVTVGATGGVARFASFSKR